MLNAFACEVVVCVGELGDSGHGVEAVEVGDDAQEGEVCCVGVEMAGERDEGVGDVEGFDGDGRGSFADEFEVDGVGVVCVWYEQCLAWGEETYRLRRSIRRRR